jgi:16S rRNA (guanine966-N2)-methyltransferase
MRVIAGTFRSRRLQTLRGLALRPSSDRLRGSLFNILGSAVEGSVFVDLFAGSGAVGIEALSRGARQVVFVENYPAGAALVRRNLESLGISVSRAMSHAAGATSAAHSGAVTAFPCAAELLTLDADAAIARLIARRIRPDFVFADPPYADSEAYESVLELLGEGKILAKDGRVIFEHSRRRVLPPVVGQLERTRVVEQGDAALSFYHPVLAA